MSTFYTSNIVSYNFLSLAIADNSNAVAGNYADNLGMYYSTNKGETWTRSRYAIDGNFISDSIASITISNDGTYAIAGSYSGNGIYYSTDGGQTWSHSSLTTYNCTSVQINSNGTNAIAGNFFNGSGIYYSEDRGQTWEQTVNTDVFYTLALSSNGINAVAGEFLGNGIYYSKNGGKDWSKSLSNILNNFCVYNIAISADGKYAMAGSYTGLGICYSIDYGVTWEKSTKNDGSLLNYSFTSVSMNKEGTCAIASTNDGNGIYYSTNQGRTWTQSTGFSGVNFFNTGMSSNGNYAIASSNNQRGIFYSNDYGETWQNTSVTSGSFFDVALNNNSGCIVGSSSNSGIYFNPEALCFNHDTKILCWSKEEGEKYVAIQDLREGDFVKSYLHGYRKIMCIGKNTMINNAKFWNLSMWKMEKANNNELIEDLIILGGHSLLVDSLSEEIKEKYKENNCFDGVSPTIDEKLFLLAAFNESFVQLKDSNVYTYYQLALDNEGDVNRRFGVWANGVLVETPCEEQFHKIKWDKID
jgi:photosystem II stability/assembly factor-like uncharacterized protein